MVIENNRDETVHYTTSRYIGPTEACWHLFEFPMHKEYPPVQPLAVHLEGKHIVRFYANTDDLEAVAERSKTTLMAWFEYNRKFTGGRNVLYPDSPYQFNWNRKDYAWQQARLARTRLLAGCIISGERLYLRLLLTKSLKQHHLRISMFNKISVILLHVSRVA